MAEPLASIVSTGISYFGRREGVYARELFREAAEEAFSNSPNLDPRRDLEAIFVGQMSDLFEHQSHVVFQAVQPQGNNVRIDHDH
ncbi:MAG: hypothetical protein ACP5K1_06990, partial [Candidatus Bathyarchaeia archaeon]